MKKATILLLFTIGFVSCKTKSNKAFENPIPPKTVVEVSVERSDDSLCVGLSNTIKYPVFFYSKDSLFNELIVSLGYNKLLGNESKKIKFKKETFRDLKYTLLNPNVISLESPKIHLPFLPQKKVKVLQGNNGAFTHYKLENKFAVDFKMDIGDTICAVEDGIVSAIRKESNRGGNSENFLGWDNFIQIYHPKLNLISFYVHLKQEGVMVELGQEIKANQPIGMVGYTGFSTEPHLHFHIVKMNDKKDIISIPFEFVEGYKSVGIKKGQFVFND